MTHTQGRRQGQQPPFSSRKIFLKGIGEGEGKKRKFRIKTNLLFRKRTTFSKFRCNTPKKNLCSY